MIYQIRIKGNLGREWAESFEGLAITLQENEETLLISLVVDQAALYGLIEKYTIGECPCSRSIASEPGWHMPQMPNSETLQYRQRKGV